MSLTYLLATLPPLELDKPAPLSLEDFFDLIQEQIEPEELELLQKLMDAPEEVRHPVLEIWTTWYRSLRHELVLFRAKDLQRSEEKNLSVERMPYAPVHLAEESLHAPDPLMGQHRLRAGEWEQLDLIEAGNYQSIVNLGIYALRLRILHKMDRYDSEQGLKRVEQYLDNSISGEIMERYWEAS